MILGPTNLPSEIPNHASQMYSSNMTRFLLNMIDKDSGELNIDLSDEIIADTLAVHEGQVTNARMRDALGLEALPSIDDEMPIDEVIDESTDKVPSAAAESSEDANDDKKTTDDNAPLKIDVTDDAESTGGAQ